MTKLKEVTLKMVIDNEGNIQKLEGFSNAMEKAERTTKRVKKEVDDTSNALGRQSRATNLAGQSALEMSRIASDAAYGMRGMANNIGQVATMMGELAKQAPKGSSGLETMSFVSQNLVSSILGPMGIIIAVQGLLSWLTVLETNSNKTAKSMGKVNDEIDRMRQKSISSSVGIEALISQLDYTWGNFAEQAKKDLAEAIPNFEKLRKTLSVKEIAEDYKKYLESLEKEEYLVKKITDAKLEITHLERKTRTLEENDKLAKLRRDEVEDERKLRGIQADRLALEVKFREEKEKRTGGSSGVAKKGYAVEFYGRPAGEILAEAEAFNEELMSLPYKKMAKYGDKAEKLYERLIKQSQEGTTISIEQVERLQALQLQSFLAVENAKQQHVETKKDLDVWWYKSSMDLVKKETREQEAAFKKRIEMQNFWTEMTGAGIANTIEMLGSMRAKNIEDEEEAFQHQKKIRTVTTIIDTLVGAQKAFNSQLIPGDPTSLVRAGVAATIAMTAGAARVAAIQAEQFKSTESTDVGDVGDTAPVTTTGFSNLSGGETPGSAVRVYVLEHDIRTTTDKVSKTKVRSRL